MYKKKKIYEAVRIADWSRLAHRNITNKLRLKWKWEDKTSFSSYRLQKCVFSYY